MSSIPPAPASVPATFMRGGTSKALFFHEKHLPGQGKARDDFLIRIMGSPNPSQIDGMGGSKIVTSKGAIIRPSTRSDADVDFTFVQVGIGEAVVAYDGNCGNISAAVGPFAINDGLVKTNESCEGKRIVRIFNTGREAILVAHIPCEPDGRASEQGDCFISGVDGTGAPILMDYSQTAKADVILPTSNVIDLLQCSFGPVEATFCKVGNPIVFIPAENFGMYGNETAAELDSDATVIKRIKEVRGRMARQLNMCSDWTLVDEQCPMLPMVAAVSRPLTARGHLQSRLFLDNHCHPAMAGTGSVCTAATSRLPGSVTNRMLSPDALAADFLVIGHPSGVIPVRVGTAPAEGKSGLPSFTVLGFMRTARTLFKGDLYVPADVYEEVVPALDKGKVTTQPAEPEPLQSGVTSTFVRFVHETQIQDLPEDVIQHMRQYLADFIGVATLG